MSNRKAKPDLSCWECGAKNDRDASECWLCQRRNWRSAGATVPAERGAFQRGDLSQWVTWFMIAAAGLLLLWSVIVIGRWVFKPFLFLLVPAVLITWVRARGGHAMTLLQFTASVLFLAVVFPVLLLTSLVAALRLICLTNGPSRFD
jgi:hypothetical protein